MDDENIHLQEVKKTITGNEHIQGELNESNPLQESKHDASQNENDLLQETKGDVTTDENNPLQEMKEDVKQDENNPLQEVKEDTSENINILLGEKKVSPEEIDIRIANVQNNISFQNAMDNIRAKKKEISWDDKDYLKTVNLQEMKVRSYTWAVERKASIGPYFQSTPSFGGPSGIIICIPKKSRKGINDDLNTMPSVINITVSKKSIVHTSMSRNNNAHDRNKLDLKIGDAPNVTFLGALRGRIHDIRDKIRNTLNI